jgi:hypothetical protein
MLANALAEARIDCVVNLHYWIPQSGGSILQAYFWLPNHHVDHIRVYVRAGVVPASERREAVLQMQQRVVPVFVRWLDCLLKLPVNSPVFYQEPWFDATWNHGEVKINQNPT